MSEKFKNKKKWIIVASILILIIILILAITSRNIEGTYTGYQLVLKASYGGYGVAGQDLGSGNKTKTYNISEHDAFNEPAFGGLWELNPIIKESSDNSIDTFLNFDGDVILEILELKGDSAKIKIKDNEYITSYNKEIKVSSNIVVSDGINYSYTIKIINKNN